MHNTENVMSVLLDYTPFKPDITSSLGGKGPLIIPYDIMQQRYTDHEFINSSLYGTIKANNELQHTDSISIVQFVLLE